MNHPHRILPVIAAALLTLAGCATPVESTRDLLMPNTAERGTVKIAKRFTTETPTVVFFDFDAARLDAQARRSLDAQARWIKRYPNVKFALVGHTDKVGASTYNDQLGLRRARAALNYLVSRGIARDRLVAMISKGESEPQVNTLDRERLNRRVTTEVMGLVDTAAAPPRVPGTGGQVVSAAATVPPAASPTEVVTYNTPEPPASTPTTDSPPDPTPSAPSGKAKSNAGKGNGPEMRDGKEMDPGNSGNTKAKRND